MTDSELTLLARCQKFERDFKNFFQQFIINDLIPVYRTLLSERVEQYDTFSKCHLTLMLMDNAFSKNDVVVINQISREAIQARAELLVQFNEKLTRLESVLPDVLAERIPIQEAALELICLHECASFPEKINSVSKNAGKKALEVCPHFGQIFERTKGDRENFNSVITEKQTNFYKTLNKKLDLLRELSSGGWPEETTGGISKECQKRTEFMSGKIEKILVCVFGTNLS